MPSFFVLFMSSDRRQRRCFFCQIAAGCPALRNTEVTIATITKLNVMNNLDHSTYATNVARKSWLQKWRPVL